MSSLRLTACTVAGAMEGGELLADRFVQAHDRWIDLATNRSVDIRIVPATSPRDQLAWSDWCARLSALRHPMLRPLVDFGALGSGHTFEAYGAMPSLSVTPAAAADLAAHVIRFLEARGIALSASLASVTLRRTEPGRTPAPRPIGIVLQRRRTLDALAEVLDLAGPAGVSRLEVAGDRGSGLATLQLLAARIARACGYVPVSSQWIEGIGAARAARLLTDRHVCVLQNGDERRGHARGLAMFLMALGRTSTRRHIVLQFLRSPGPRPGLALDLFGMRDFVAMTYMDAASGPTCDEVFAAARRAAGLPGVFLKVLGCAEKGRTVAMVHEQSIPYRVDEPPSGTPALMEAVRPRRAAVRAIARAQSLASRGRHAAAGRLLARATMVLTRRTDPRAAIGLVDLGWLLLSRGRSGEALDRFTQAERLSSPPTLLPASLGAGVALIEEDRLPEAEAALRSLCTASEHAGDAHLRRSATAALARAVALQGRGDEALALLTPHVSAASPPVRLVARASRILASLDDTREAIRMARRALALAISPADIAAAHRALAIALDRAGDCWLAAEQARIGLRAARAGHLPVIALRLRLTRVEAALNGGARTSEVIRATRRLERLARRGGPPLLRRQILAACGRMSKGSENEAGYREMPRSELEVLIELCHGAPDERAALALACRHALEALRAASLVAQAGAGGGRTLALAGRPWPAESHAVARALASGTGVAPEPGAGGVEAAEPVRFGGAILGAVACRWTPATPVDAGRTVATLRALALAVAPSVHALRDGGPCSPPEALPDMVGDSAKTRALRDAILRAAHAPFPVLILGESGSGKELVARGIHRLGPRRERRFCAINCAALPDELLEAELFGHTRGAFTGALTERPGLFEEADGGTLFLDEIGELSPRAQSKLLRVLQDGEVRRVGENLSRRVDARIIAATNRRLDAEVEAGRFRADLRFRLDVVRLTVPPLRERPDDIPLLAAHFWRDAAGRVGSRASLAPETVSALARYHWPGNVRELQNVMAWMAVHSPRRGRVGVGALPAQLVPAAAPAEGSFDAARLEFERHFVRAALARAGGRRGPAAQALGVTRQGLAKMLRRLGLHAP